MHKSNATLQPVGIDDFQAKFMKYVDEKVHSAIADTCNTTVETADLLRETNTRLLLPL